MTVKAQLFSHNQQVIVKLIDNYLSFAQVNGCAYDNLACLLLEIPQDLDKQHAKFLEPIATCLTQPDYQAFTKKQILTKLKEKYPAAKLDANSSIAQILAWAQQNKPRTTIGLSAELFKKFSSRHSQALGAALKMADVYVLDMRWSKLYQLTPEQWRTLGTILKHARLQALDLRKNELCLLTSVQWQALGAALKDTGLQALNLRKNELHKLTIEQLQALGEILRAAGIKELDLAANDLHKLTVEQWQALAVALKAAGIQTLSLRKNWLCKLKPKEWQAFCEFLKVAGIQALDLAGNALYELAPERWQELAAALKTAGTQALDLSWSGLFLFKPKQWQLLGEFLKKAGIKTLNLSQNIFFKLTHKEWQALGQALKTAGIESLDLSWNELYLLTREQKQAFYQMLKTSGVLYLNLETETLSLDDAYWTIMLQNHCESIFKADHHLEELPFQLALQAFEWPYPLTDEKLACFVKQLEASKDPVAILIAGLLVLGYCNNFPDSDNEAYREKRIHDGISLLLQAANKGLPLQLDHKLNHFLWHLKVIHTEEYPSVAKRLGQLWLRPQIDTYHYFSARTKYPVFSLNWRQEHRLQAHVTPAEPVPQPESLVLIPCLNKPS